MAEVIGVASNVAQLITLAAQITKLSYGYIVDVRNASRTQKAYLQEVSALTDTLFRLEEALHDSDSLRNISSSGKPFSSSMITECQQSLALQRSKLGKHTHSLIWPFQDRDMKRAIDDLHRFRSMFADFMVANVSLVLFMTVLSVPSKVGI